MRRWVTPASDTKYTDPGRGLRRSTTQFEMYPVGLTSIAAYLEANNYKTRLVNLAYRMLQTPGFDVGSQPSRGRPVFMVRGPRAAGYRGRQFCQFFAAAKMQNELVIDVFFDIALRVFSRGRRTPTAGGTRPYPWIAALAQRPAFRHEQASAAKSVARRA